MFKNQDDKLRFIQPGLIIIGTDIAKRSRVNPSALETIV